MVTIIRLNDMNAALEDDQITAESQLTENFDDNRNKIQFQDESCPPGTGKRIHEGIIPENVQEEKEGDGGCRGAFGSGTRWSRSSDFFFSSLSYTLAPYTVCSLPLSVIKNGGVTFLLMYCLLLIMIGAPLLLVELFLGQYSGRALPSLFRNLVPILRGIGPALCLVAVIRSLIQISAITWMARTVFLLFFTQEIKENMFYDQVLMKPESSNISTLGPLQPELVLCLGISLFLLFILSFLGPRVLGKVCGVLVFFAFGFLITLCIRTSLTPNGPTGVLALLTPDWKVAAKPTLWLELTGQLIFSLQLGSGVHTTLASYNKFKQNLVRDTAILIGVHLLWVLLATYLVLSLFAITDQEETSWINIKSSTNETLIVTSSAGYDVWLMLITILESAMPKLNCGWLWASLSILLLMIISFCSLLGNCELLLSSLLSPRRKLLPWRPLILLLLIAAILILTLPLTTQGSIHIYHLLLTYLNYWPLLFFSILILFCSIRHGPHNLLADLSSMSSMDFSHWVSSHFSVLLYTLIPLLLITSLSWHFYMMYQEHLLSSLQSFGISIQPPEWGPHVALGVSFLPLVPLILGVLYHFTLGARGTIWSKHTKNSFNPTIKWLWRDDPRQ